MSFREPAGRWPLPDWAPAAALLLSLAVAWANFFGSTRWADIPGSLHGWREPWYLLALGATTFLALITARRIGQPARLGTAPAVALLLAGAVIIVTAFLGRQPVGNWTEIPFKDNWTELFVQASNGVALLKRGAVVGYNWWLLGGYPTSTDIAQNFGTVAFVPMTLLGDRLGYHVLHLVLFLAVPVFIWWDLRREARETRVVATALACCFAAGYTGPLGSSGDTNSLVGVCSAALAMAGGYAARLGSRWGGPVLLLGLTLAACTHTAFCIYAGIYLTVEAVYYRDRAAFVRLIAAGAIAAIAALPMHWESLLYPEYVSFNNTVYEPGAPMDWSRFLFNIYYNVEILALPHRWFNDYRGLANVWLAVLIVTALLPGRTRTGYWAWTAVITQLLLRLNTSEAGAVFDRIQHMFPLLMGPALAGFVVRCAGSRPMAAALAVVLALFVQTAPVAVRHVPDLRAWDPPLMDRIAASDGMVLVEISPHRDMDSSPTRRSITTPFDVHFEGLLPGLAGQRFYSQMIDGWVWNIYRGQVVGAGTFLGRPIEETPAERFTTEMARWGVRHLFVWTDATRAYLHRAEVYTERWRGGHWSHFERVDADVRDVVVARGYGLLRDLDFLGGTVALTDVTAGDTVRVRANYYPAWRAFVDNDEVTLSADDGQMTFVAPRSGTYDVRLEYPTYRGVSLLAILAFVVGAWALSRTRRPAATTPTSIGG